MVKSVSELVDVDDPAWPLVSSWLESSSIAAALPVESDAGRECLRRLQVTAGSILGALALHTGGILVDHGWLRILGGGGSGLIDLASINDAQLSGESPNGPLIIGFDVLGGRFAIDGGGLGGEPGEIAYWAPDTLAWEGLGVGHSAFMEWVLVGGRLGQFYADFRWEGWADEVQAVGLDQALSVWPPLGTAEARPIAKTSRRPVPRTELEKTHNEISQQLGPRFFI